MVCSFKKYTLHFKKPGGTSRGILYDKDTYILALKQGDKTAYGECNLFKGLSVDDRDGYEEKLAEVCMRLPGEKESILPELIEWPSIYFGVETLLRNLENGCRQIIFPDAFSNEGTFTIPINGLIWMGSEDYMLQQIDKKLSEGFGCIKMKIGAVDFQTELSILEYIRSKCSTDSVTLRLDANGAFDPAKALEKLQVLSQFGIEYIEQPIKAGQWKSMASLVDQSSIPIALDEELIGIFSLQQKRHLVASIKPQVLILKPALIGGFKSCDEWKELMNEEQDSCIITSALESNIGLNAIAQYTAVNTPAVAQGLGTGTLYTNNIPSPYYQDANGLHYSPDQKWDFNLLQ